MPETWVSLKKLAWRYAVAPRGGKIERGALALLILRVIRELTDQRGTVQLLPSEREMLTALVERMSRSETR